MTRRRFLRTAAAGSVFGFGNLGAFLPLSPATAQETEVAPDIVRYGPETEPLVRLIEETPIERCPEMLARELHSGVSYRRLLAALFLAALRGPSTIAHSVFVIHSAHQLALDAPTEERLLPLFWAVNNYKHWSAWHAKNPQRLRSFGGVVPSARNAEADFHAAMERVDHDKAEAALLALARSEGLARVAEALWAYSAKDCVDIGHNAIAVTSTWRVLPTIGMQHAEPILRWVLERLMSNGDATYWPNRERVSRYADKLPAGWATADSAPPVSTELLALMREVNAAEACELAAASLARGSAHAGAVWDAIHLHAAELMLRKADDGHCLHANTGANALHHAFRMCIDPSRRLLILLQAIAWQCQHRRRKLETDPEWRASDLQIDALESRALAETPEAAARDVLAAIKNRREAAAMAASYARLYPDAEIFMQAARRAVVTKATENAHDLKYPIAMFEDYALVDARWRPAMLAAAVQWLPSSDQPDSKVVQEARAAVGNG